MENQIPLVFKGADYKEERDKDRLQSGYERVKKYMLSIAGTWAHLALISEMSETPEASASRYLRYLKEDGIVVEKKYVRSGLYIYRVNNGK